MKTSRKKSCAITAARWISYAAAGAVTAVGAANDAEAGILFSGVLNQAMPHSAGSVNLAIKTLIANSDQGVENIGRFTHITKTLSNGLIPLGSKMNYYLHFRGSSGNGDKVHGEVRGSTTGAVHYVSRLGSGVKISSGNFIGPKGANPMGTCKWTSLQMKQLTLAGDRKWSAAGTAFVGFEFNLNSGNLPADEQYGWAKVIDNGPTSYYMTLVEYAYGSPGQAITAGETGVAVPEPASLGLLALGAAGLLGMRFGRRRKAPQAIA